MARRPPSRRRPAWRWQIGATEEELVEILIAAAPTVGTALVVAAAPKLALAIGYDVEAALEERTRDERPHRKTVAQRRARPVALIRGG